MERARTVGRAAHVAVCLEEALSMMGFQATRFTTRSWLTAYRLPLIVHGWFIELRPSFQYCRRVLLVDVARAKLVGLLRRWLTCIACVARAACGLIGGRAERPEQLHKVSAAFDTSKPCGDFAAPTWTDFYTGELLEIRRDVAAHRIRTGFGVRFGIMNQEVEVDRKPQPHVVHGLSRTTLGPAVPSGMCVCLGINELRLDVPQTIVSFVTFALDGASVYELARRGRGQRH
ncbi:MAG: hypothetical protein QOK44_1425 [Betaproteobacteria bacterium]|nr:hypothetical protein [Betaproteobacteria bacterium]